jgi:hypothetical protein
MNMLANIYSRYKQKKILRKQYIEWAKRKFAAPSPTYVKNDVILRNGIPGATWVETGTYKGDTSALLASHAKMVYTIEPAEQLYLDARERFRDTSNVEVINGMSEQVFPTLLGRLNGPVNFWLDGHYSTGVTFQGPKDCPLVEELDSIEKNLKNFSQVVILIDDVRYCANPEVHQFSGYPKLDVMVEWARKNGLFWHIEHDTMVIKSRELYTERDV